MNMDISRLEKVPQHPWISVLFSDDDIVVINKPCDLRSVPGHAEPPTSKNAGVGDVRPRLTAHEAWVESIRQTSAAARRKATGERASAEPSDDSDGGGKKNNAAAADECFRNLTTADPAYVPRKLGVFVRYCHRNSRRLFPSREDLHSKGRPPVDCGTTSSDDWPPPKKRRSSSMKRTNNEDGHVPTELRDNAQQCFGIVRSKQIPLMNLPSPTEDHESAVGQLRLLGFGDHCGTGAVASSGPRCDAPKRLHVVHRLDCQTSGVMVVARTRSAASALCKAWREGDSVKKVYTAHVLDWPPYRAGGSREGTIDVALGPSLEERIKRVVRPSDRRGGQKSVTRWRVETDPGDGVVLELRPLTGRTHQLRVHCAVAGSGIVWDSLYNDSPIEWTDGGREKEVASSAATTTRASKTLRLHAARLTFRPRIPSVRFL